MSIFLYLSILFLINEIECKSKEYYNCLNKNPGLYSSSSCTSIEIPETDGYKCCYMKIKYNGEYSFNCIPIENKYSQNKESLKEYISSNSLLSLFTPYGGEREINCGETITISEEYKNFSTEYLNCFNNHIDGVNNSNDCHKNEIPKEDKGKCCYVETYQKKENNSFTHDKRCYIVDDQYFSGKKILRNFVSDFSNLKNLDELKNANISVNCKNYPIFFYQGKSDSDPSSNGTDINHNTDSEFVENNSGLETWVIIIIVFANIFLIAGLGLFIYYYYKKNSNNLLTKKLNDIDEVYSIMD